MRQAVIVGATRTAIGAMGVATLCIGGGQGIAMVVERSA